MQFPDINGFQETTLAPVKSNGKWVSHNGFFPQDPPSVQIHLYFCSNFIWVPPLNPDWQNSTELAKDNNLQSMLLSSSEFLVV
jgi:hypothetical protein